MDTKTIPPTPPRVRLTISVTPAVHATFQRLARAAGTSISFQMGEWLSDTLDAAEHMTSIVERARAAPSMMAKELHAYAVGLSDELGAVTAAMTKAEPRRMDGAPKRSARAGRVGVPDGLTPPSSNTGGKPPLKGQRHPKP